MTVCAMFSLAHASLIGMSNGFDSLWHRVELLAPSRYHDRSCLDQKRVLPVSGRAVTASE